MGLMAYAHATWFASPNQDLAPVMSLGTGMSVMADRMDSDGTIPACVSFRPAKMTVSLQNWNLDSLITIPFCAQRER